MHGYFPGEKFLVLGSTASQGIFQGLFYFRLPIIYPLYSFDKYLVTAKLLYNIHAGVIIVNRVVDFKYAILFKIALKAYLKFTTLSIC